MPKQQHRGAHPQDDRLFGVDQRGTLREAALDLCWLYSRRYADASALKIVGDHYQLAARQRTALQRVACSDASLASRRERAVSATELENQTLEIDGYNVLISVEAALSGGVLLRARDGCIRDMASLHGSYRRVEETVPAVELIGVALEPLRPRRVCWLLDAPVSNSGRLRSLILSVAKAREWPWDVELESKVDRRLSGSPHIVLTSDSGILNSVRRWHNLLPQVLGLLNPTPRVVDLGLCPIE